MVVTVIFCPGGKCWMRFLGDGVGVMVGSTTVDDSVEMRMGEAETVAVSEMSVDDEVFGMDVEIMLQPAKVRVNRMRKISFFIVFPPMDKETSLSVAWIEIRVKTWVTTQSSLLIIRARVILSIPNRALFGAG
jgi:hypothetical protein